jgi:hypothetical protein
MSYDPYANLDRDAARGYDAGVAAERERCAQVAESEAAKTDLMVECEETRIAGTVLRNFAAHLRGQGAS